MPKVLKKILLVATCAMAALCLMACSNGGTADSASQSANASADAAASQAASSLDADSAADGDGSAGGSSASSGSVEDGAASSASASGSSLSSTAASADGVSRSSSSQYGGSEGASSASSSSAKAGYEVDGKHVIGVAVYDNTDSEVQMFKDYLVNYVAGTGFDDVRFVYSGNIESEDDVLSFIDTVAEQGGEGVMSFYNVDLEAEVERCAKHGMYHMVASGTVSSEDFVKVADNEYFLGAVGPMVAMEYNAGANMTWNYIANKVGDRYFIMSGGASQGNEMHYQRTFGMLDALETAYGVDLGNTKLLAATDKAETLSVENVTVTIAPGYVSIDDQGETVKESFESGEYDVVLSALPVDPVLDTLEASEASIAQVDCYSQDNQILFNSGKLHFLVGKYGSVIGPSFAAMYNAVTGHAADFRDDGKAFQIVQNFWSSSDKSDFDKKYELASNMTKPAYNLEDLYSVCKEYNSSATLEDLVELASACSFEEAQQRRM